SQITGAVKTGFDYNKTKEQTLLGFEIKLKGRKEAEDFFRQIESFAARAPQELGQVLESTQRLMSAFKPDQALQALSAITDAVAFQGKVGGEAQESINGIGTALSQVLYKNKLSAEEMMQLAERQINGYKYLAAEIAKTDKAFAALTDEEQQGRVQEMAQKGLLNAKTAVAVIIRGMQAEFGGTAERIAKETAAGMESNISDSLNRTAGIASQSAFERYKQFLGKVNQLLQTGAAERIAGGVSATTGAIFDGMEKTLNAVMTGNLGQLGLDAVNSAAGGVRQGAKAVYDAGAEAGGQLEKGWRDRLDQHSPSAVMQRLGFEAGASLLTGFVQGATREGESVAEYFKRLAQDPRIRAWFEVLRQVEGGGPRTVVGGRQFPEGLREHPGSIGMGMMGPKGWSTAAGNWQITQTNWHRLAPSLGLNNFSDVNQQMIAALALFGEKGGIPALLSGDLTGALRASQPWAGSPLSTLPGRKPLNAEQFIARYQQQLGGAAAGGAVPVVIQNLPTLQDFFGQFVGKGYTPGIALGHNVPDRPASGDLTGGVGYFAEDFNPRGFAEKLYALQKSMPGGDRTTVAAQADWQHTVSMMAEEFHISRAVMLKIQDMVARRLEEERQQLASLQSGGAGNFLNITPEQARHAVEIATRGTGEIKQETAELATTVVPQVLASVQLVAKETGDAFTDLPPLVKASGKEIERDMTQLARTISGMLGGVLQSVLRGQWRDGLRGLRDDFLSWTVSMAQDWFESRIFKALSGQGTTSSGAASSGRGGSYLTGGFAGGPSPAAAAVTGGGGGGIIGTVKRLFGLGGSSSSPGAGDGISVPAALSSRSGPWVDPAAFTAQFGNAPALAGLGKASSFGFGATKFNALAPLLGMQLGGGLVSALAGPQAGGLAGILGTGGGLLAGIGLTGAPTAIGAGGALSGLGFLGPLFSNPITAIVGGALLVGGVLLGRQRQRRADETTRNAISNDTGQAIWDLIGRARDLTPSQANQEWRQIEQNYQQQIAQIRDGKTKRHAQLQWTNDFLPLKRIVDQRVAEGEKARAFTESFVPTFSQGGGVAYADGGALSGFARRAYVNNPLGYVRGPGTPKSDSIMAYFPAARRHARISDSEYVLDAETTRNVGVERLDRLRASKGRGLAEGGSVATAPGAGRSMAASRGGSVSSEVVVNVLLGKEDITRAFITVARSQEFRDAVVGAAWDDLDRRGDLLSKILLETICRRK
ncbi:MAG TPA: tape measure protein, partial [Pyrinomonadaceae bacterium]